MVKKIQIKPRSIKDIIYKEIKKLILSGEIKPGERLIEQELSQQFEVSRTPLREAIQILETEQLVTKVSSGGVMATCLSAREVIEIYELRKCVEAMIIKKVATNHQPDQLSELAEIVEKIKSLLNSAEDDRDEEFVLLGSNFHKKIHQIYGNSVCIKVLQDLQSKIDRYSHIAARNNYETVKRASNEHIKLFNFLQQGLAVEAEKAMSDHLQRAEQDTLKQLESYDYDC